MRALFSMIVGLVLMLSLPAQADPESYRLDQDRSEVGFGFTLQGATVEGIMPVTRAEMEIDLDNVPASRVDVTLDASAARAGVFFVTQTMRGPQVLATDQYPTVRFSSTAFNGDLSGATVTGDLTIGGMTKPATFKAELVKMGPHPFNPEKQVAGMRVTGEIDRTEFGIGFGAPAIGAVIPVEIDFEMSPM